MLAILALAAATAASAGESPSSSSATVHFADGTQVPLFNWTLSYEFVSGKPGAMPTQARRRDSQTLHLGGKELDVRGAQLDLQYEMFEHTRETDDGTLVKEKRPRVVAVTLTRDGKKTKLKPQSPERSFLVGNEKAVNVLPRTLDLLGETVTGTRRELCVVAFTGLAECASADDARVTRIDFK